MTDKSYFARRSVAQMKDLNVALCYHKHRFLSSLMAADETRIIQMQERLLPNEWYYSKEQQKDASNRIYKHGPYLSVKQPKTWGDALEIAKPPKQILLESLDEFLGKNTEFDTHVTGFRWNSFLQNDRRTRELPFDILVEGMRLYTYANELACDIQITDKYTTNPQVATQGGRIVASVPSRTKKQPRYVLELGPVPLENTDSKYALPWSLDVAGQTNLPGSDLWRGGVRYGIDTRIGNEVLFGPHSVAAYHAIENAVAQEMSLFAKPTDATMQLFHQMQNNVLVYDITLDSKDKLRHMHDGEITYWLGRFTKRVGVEKAWK